MRKLLIVALALAAVVSVVGVAVAANTYRIHKASTTASGKGSKAKPILPPLEVPKPPLGAAGPPSVVPSVPIVFTFDPHHSAPAVLPPVPDRPAALPPVDTPPPPLPDGGH